MSRTRRMNADEVEKILQQYGFELVSQKVVIVNGEILKDN
ncbi:hypothetical protein Riv7116_4644 [Rivularia sp. PCC 7116]|nr:hypothetical protein Riv7116_4644 [Rivularia sp. PCC 7116]